MDAELLLWTKITAIGQIAGAFATALAVAVSLWVVLSERQPRVKVRAGLRLLITQGRPELSEEVINITVENTGQRPVSVNSIGWRVGWVRRFGPKWMHYGFAMQSAAMRRDSHDPPYVIEPGQEKVMLVNLEPFHGDGARSQRTADMFVRTVPFLGPTPANIRCAAHVVGARSRYFKVERTLAEFLATGKSTGALERLKESRDRKAQDAHQVASSGASR